MRYGTIIGRGGMALGLTAVCACSGGEPTHTPAPAPKVEAPPPEAPPKEAKRPEGPLPGLIMVQAWFKKEGKLPKPQPAKMVLYQMDGDKWYDTTILDDESNVFHKGMWWRDGILTIGAMKAKLKHWKKDAHGEWKATQLWEQSWGGKFDRMRDMEIADVDADGKEEIIIATHDQGVVAVGDENEDGTWTFQEFDRKPDTFVHEVEVGDVDADGKLEFYVTPSDRNKSSGVSQPGGVARYDYAGGTYKRSQVVQWEESHAKEILVTDVDGDKVSELYVVKEGHVEKSGKKTTLVDPVTIVRMVPPEKKGGAWQEVVVSKLEGDAQCRFLTMGDIDGDGKNELIAAGMDTGLWALQLNEDGTFTNKLIDAKSGGFEHATHVADLDGDGKVEVYVASDKQQELRQYVFVDGSWQRHKIADIPPSHITWNLQDGTF